MRSTTILVGDWDPNCHDGEAHVGFADAATARYELDPTVDGFTDSAVDWEGTLRPLIDGTKRDY